MGRYPVPYRYGGDAREGPNGPAAARDLVAIWAGLRRLSGKEVREAQARLDEVVAADAGALAVALTALVFRADEWRRRVDELDLAWDAGDIDEEELDWQTYLLFEELDQTSLACWFLSNQVGDRSEPVERIAREVDQANAHLTDKAIVFLSLGTDAVAVLSDSQPDLESSDLSLWRTLLKHARIEAARDEVERRPDRAQLVTAIGGEKQEWTTRLPAEAASRAAELQYAQAASGPAADPLFRELGRASPEDIPAADYRSASARFLASTAQGTSVREAWRDRFLTLAREQPLDEEWLIRLYRAENLAGERDWQRHFQNVQVLQLEPRPFTGLTDLAGWVRALVGSAGEDAHS